MPTDKTEKCPLCDTYYVIVEEDVCPKCQEAYMNEYWEKFMAQES